MTPPLCYRLLLVPLLPVFYAAALVIKVCNFLVWWRLESVEIGGRRIL